MKCCFCSQVSVGDDVFPCTGFIDLLVSCDITAISPQQFSQFMAEFPIKVQRYVSLVMSLIKKKKKKKNTVKSLFSISLSPITALQSQHYILI